MNDNLVLKFLQISFLAHGLFIVLILSSTFSLYSKINLKNKLVTFS